MGVISPVRLYYPKSAVMFQRYATVTVGNALLLFHDAVEDFAHLVYQFVPANGDTFTHPFYLQAGVYTLNVLGMTTNGNGKIDWYIDNVKVVSGQDWYTVGIVYNVIMTAAVTVYGHGQHVLKGVVNGQNGASLGFYIMLTAIALV